MFSLIPLAVLAWVSTAAQPAPTEPQAIMERAVADFKAGRVYPAADGFDKLAQMLPQVAPQLWQRGIALYYVGRFRDCRKQFEAHRTVNPDDVENAAWHFLCVARDQSPEKAKAALLPVGHDSRAPMREIYEMFRGARTPAEVLSAAGSDPSAQFYAHLYVGLYFEVTGDKAGELEHITAAAADRYARDGGYMHMVAQVHLDQLRRRKKK